MNVTRNQAWIAGTGVLAVLVLAATYLLLVAPQRAEAADLATERAAVAASNAALESRTAELKAQFATLDVRRAELAAIRETLPAEADVPALLRQLETTASDTGVTLTGITPSAIEAYTGAPADVSGASIYDVPLTLTTTGTFAETELFVKALQADVRRFFLIENLSLSADEATATDGSTAAVSTTLTGKIFVLRTAQDDATATATAEGTTTDAETVS
ncbi:type 4a pilus biogenesis protein PilO [Kineococcus glutinatus]|uniref:Type IV pilus assembly protein PilO n=1 Tax=Kineococcus glutinatus TaxID=1070872 RepID=A0ABP9HCS4_9ACTN